MDFRPGRNESLREQVTEAFGEDYFERQVGSQEVSDDPLLTNYSTPDGVEYSEKTIDLAALEYWHDNDVNNVQQNEAEELTEAIGPVNEARGVTKEAMNNPQTQVYPNGDIDERAAGHFDYDELLMQIQQKKLLTGYIRSFSNFNSVSKALDPFPAKTSCMRQYFEKA